MVDISDKEASSRVAVARSSIHMNQLVYEAIQQQQIKKVMFCQLPK